MIAMRRMCCPGLNVGETRTPLSESPRGGQRTGGRNFLGETCAGGEVREKYCCECCTATNHGLAKLEEFWLCCTDPSLLRHVSASRLQDGITKPVVVAVHNVVLFRENAAASSQQETGACLGETMRNAGAVCSCAAIHLCKWAKVKPIVCPLYSYVLA